MNTIKEHDKWKAGLPYRGNKRQKVNQILDLLPDGNRFVDAFGGGGCVSLHAATSGKYDQVVYNELDSDIYQLFTEFAIKHNQIDLKRFVAPSRERFFIAKNREHRTLEDNIILTCWSFSNDRKCYLFGPKNQIKSEVAKKLFEEVPHKSIKETYAIYHRWRRDRLQRLEQLERLQQLEQLQQLERLERLQQLEQLQRLEQLERLQQLEQLQQLERLERLQQLEQLQQLERLERLQQLEQLQQLERLERLETVNGSYEELDIKPDDVVYCDPPYVNTEQYEQDFDGQAFIDWYSNICPAKEIYISEYTQLPNTEIVADLGKKHCLTARGKKKQELLFKVIK